MNFLELKERFESKLNNEFEYELLDFSYSPFSFGSGLTVYKIKGRILKVIYNGRDNEIQFFSSKPHDRYPNAFWTTIFTGHPSKFIENAIVELNNLYKI